MSTNTATTPNRHSRESGNPVFQVARKNSMQFVYILTNSAMPNLVKIGYTTQEDINSRISQLYTTGVPVPFDVEYVCRVQNAEEVEKALHTAFAPNRINPKREFFQIDPEQAKAILRLLHTEDATNEVTQQQNIDIDQQSQQAAERLKARRPNLNFTEMGIPMGAELQSTQNESVVVTVVEPRKVQMNDKVMSLTEATRVTLGLDYNVQPGPYWVYQGKSIRDIYEETYCNTD